MVKLKKYSVYLSILLWGMVNPISSQNPYIRHYTTFDGLPSNTIYNVCQDSRKFIWFATDAGAVKYDGSKFVTFTKREGLNTSKIVKIKEDSKGRIWIFNWDGSINYYYRNIVFNSFNAPFLDSLKPNEPFHDFFEDDDHTIYFFNVMYEIYSVDSNNQVKKFDKLSEYLIENLRNKEGLKATGPYPESYYSSFPAFTLANLYQIRKMASREYLFWTKQGMFKVKELFKDPLMLHYNFKTYQRASCSRFEYFYILHGSQSIKKFKDEMSPELILMPAPIFIWYTMSRQNALLVDKEGLYWVGTFDDGLYCLEEDTIIQQQSADSRVPQIKSSKILQHLDIRRVNGLIQDHEGNIWVSSSEEGVYKISPYLNSHRHYENTLFQSKGIREMAPDISNGMWLSNGRTVYLLQADSLYTLGFQEKNTSFNVLYHLKTNKLILGEKYSFFYIVNDPITDLDTKKVNYSSVDTSGLYMSGITINEKEDKINCFNYFNFDLIDPDTLFGMYQSEIEVWQKDYNVGSRINYTYYNTRDQLIINARKNYILLGDTCIPAGELSRFDNKVIIQQINLSDKVELLNIENDHIFLLSNQKIYDLSDALHTTPDLRIKSICYNDPVLYMADSRNVFWCSNPLDILAGKAVNLSVLDISFRNIHKILSNNDSLYIASDDGLTIIPEKKIESIVSQVPIPYLESLLVNNKEVDITPDKLILHGRNTLKFTIGTINYSSSPVIYSYMLEGADKDWSTGKSNIIVYKNLPKGDYIFKVRANKPNSGWSETIEYHVRVKYTLWEHPLFFAALALLALLLIFFFIVRKKNLQIRRRELDHQLITLEQKALQSMMNPHFIFNSLGSIQNYLMQNRNGEAGQYLSQFARLIRQNLNAINAAMIILEDEADRLKNYLDLEKMRLPDKFGYQIRMDDSLESDEIYIPSMIVQPFVENAVWHGITQLEGMGEVTILFEKESENSLKITVQDNGIGMKKSAAFSSKKENHLGLSLDLTLKRLKLLGEKYKVKTTVQFSEAKPGAENPGTCVVIIVPVSFSSRET